MPIRLLADIVVTHPYFASGQCAAAQLVPDAATAARLAGLRMIVKPKPAGLGLFIDLDAAGKPKLAVPDKTMLRFELRRLPAEIAAATDLSAIRPGAVFTDAGVAAGAPLKLVQRETRATETLAKPVGAATLTLSGRPLATAKPGDFKVPAGVTFTGYDATANRVALAGPAGDVVLDYPVAPAMRPDVLAPVEITVGADTVVQAAAGNPRRVSIALQTVAARWVYHLVTNLPNPIGDLHVKSGNGGGPAVAFGDAGRAEIADNAADDRFGADLATRSAPLRVVRFVSDAPVAASETVARRIALFAGAQQLVAALPNPSPAALRMIGGAPAFGAVLRFVTA